MEGKNKKEWAQAFNFHIFQKGSVSVSEVGKTKLLISGECGLLGQH